MRIHYFSTHYPSYRRAALANARLLAERAELVDTACDADAVIVHGPIVSLDDMWALLPGIDRVKRRVGYLVWETDRLNPAHAQKLSRFDELWTASEFCADIFRRHHDNVHVIPHPVDPAPAVTPQLAHWLRGLCGTTADDIVLLGLAITNQSRKNTDALCEAFADLNPRMPRARLVIKAWSDRPQTINYGPGVRTLLHSLSDAEMAALIQHADILVSPHHAEGFGLNLADAMCAGTAVVATGWSGNMEFMRADNSYVVDYTLAPLRPPYSTRHYDAQMRWAYPDPAHLRAQILSAYEDCVAARAEPRLSRAQQTLQAFSSAAIGAKISARLHAWA